MKLARNKNQAFVVWFTGLPASGKTTLAKQLYSFYKKQGLQAEHIDGDIVRKVFPQTGYSKNERNEHILRMGFIAALLERNGIIVIASFISPYREARLKVRQMCKRFIEVYVSTSLEECEKRDPKGLYKKARTGNLKHFTGINDPYEKPKNSEIIIDTKGAKVKDSLSDLILNINNLNSSF